MALTKVSSNLVADDAIVTGKIADGGVDTADLAANAVTTAKIAQNNVTAHHIADGSVTVTQLGADAVTAAKVADDAISEEHLDKTIISDMTAVTPVAGDFVLLGDTSDSNNLKKSALTLLLNSNVDLSTKLNLSGGTMTGNIAHASNFTLDVGGNIELDADGGQVIFMDGGTNIGRLENSSSDFVIKSMVNDKDIIFKGEDGGSGITALTLDMSTGGTAYFADDVRLTDNHALRLGTDGDIVFYHDNSNGHLESAGNFTLNVAGDIILDADGEQVNFSHAGTVIGQVDMGSNNYTLRSKVDNKDIEFHGTSSGNVVALKLDMSEAGAATFNSQIGVGAAPLQDVKLDLHTAGSTAKPLAIRITNAASTNYAWEIWRDNTDGDLRFGEELNGTDTTRVTFESGGNVGIGITTPNESGFGATSNVLSIAGTAQDAFGVLELISTDVTSSNRIGEIRFGNLDAGSSFASNAGIRATRDGADNSSALSLWYSNAGTFTQGLYISSQGTIGMGAGSGSLAGSIIISNDGGTGTINNAYYNTGLGWEVFDDLTTGDSNTMIGNQAGYKLTTGSNNVGVGRLALANIDTGDSNIAIGYNALATLAGGYHQNIAIGYDAMKDTTVNTGNIAIGAYAFDDSNSASSTQCIAIGYNSMSGALAGYGNTAVGDSTMQIASSAFENTAIGRSALLGLTTGDNNTAVGSTAGSAITSGANNVAIGAGALIGTCTGSHNVAIGTDTLKAVSSGGENVAIGRDAGNDISSASQNVAVGHESLTKNQTGTGNTAVGFQALENASGGGNTALGWKAGEATEGGVFNVFIGENTRGTHPSHSQAIAIGRDIDAAPGQVAIGTSAMGKTYNEFNTDALWSNGSDVRLKQNITDSTLGLNFINDLRPVTYTWKPSNELPEEFPMYQEENGRDTETIMTGLIAQEVKTAIDTSGVSRFAGWGEDNDGIQQVRGQAFVFPLIKAVQELTAKVKELEKKLEG